MCIQKCQSCYNIHLDTFQTLQNFGKSHFEIPMSLATLLIYACYECAQVFLISLRKLTPFMKTSYVRFTKSMCLNMNLSGISDNYNILEIKTILNLWVIWFYNR